MISSTPHSVSGPLTLNSSVAVSSVDRTLVTGLVSGAISSGTSSGSAGINGSVPFFYNHAPSRSHPNFNPTKPVVAINRNLESNIRSKGKGEKPSKNRKQKQSNSKEDIGKSHYSSNPSPYNDFNHHGYYPDDSAELEESEATVNHQKQVSSTRFNRNNYLISEVFNDKVMPDVRQTVSTTRVEVLRRQAESLILHQERSMSELTAMEEHFKERKRRMLETSEDFNRQIDRLSRPAYDENTFQAMVNRALMQIKDQHEEAKNRPKEFSTPSGQPKAPPPNNQQQQPPRPLSSSSPDQAKSSQPPSFQSIVPAGQFMPHPGNAHSNVGALSQPATTASRGLPPQSQCNSNQSNSGNDMAAQAFDDQSHQVSPGSASGKSGPGQQQQQYHGNHATSFNYIHSSTNQHNQPPPSHLHASQSPHQHPQQHSHQYTSPAAAASSHSHPNHPSGYQWPSYSPGSTAGHQPSPASYQQQPTHPHSASAMHPSHHSQQGPHPPNGNMLGKHHPPPGQMEMNYNLRAALSGPNAPGGPPPHPMTPNASGGSTYLSHNSNQANSIVSMANFNHHRLPHGSYYPPGHHPHQNRLSGPMQQQHPHHQYPHQHPGAHQGNAPHGQFPHVAGKKGQQQAHPNFNPNCPGPYAGAPPSNASVPPPANASPKKKKSKSTHQNDDSVPVSKKVKKGNHANDTSELKGETNSKGKNSKKNSEPKTKSPSKKKVAAEKAREKGPEPVARAPPPVMDADEDKKSDVTEVDTDNETIMSSLDDDRTMMDDESLDSKPVTGTIANEKKSNSVAKQVDSKKKSKKTVTTNSLNSKVTTNHSKSKEVNNVKRKADDVIELEDEDDEEVDEADFDDDYDDELDDDDDEEEEVEDDNDSNETDDTDDDNSNQLKANSRKRTNSGSLAKSGAGRKRANHSVSRNKSNQRNLRQRKG